MEWRLWGLLRFSFEREARRERIEFGRGGMCLQLIEVLLRLVVAKFYICTIRLHDIVPPLHQAPHSLRREVVAYNASKIYGDV
jgi:hypothetical protein